MTTLVLLPYQTAWPDAFAALAGALAPALHRSATYAEHVGSTAVPGMLAKPIIDIDLVYPTAASFSLLQEDLAELGYLHHGDQGIPGREVFKRARRAEPHPVLDQLSHHLYANHREGAELNRHLVFRDHLRTYASARHAYARLKTELAHRAGWDRKKYAELKEERARPFIEGCLAAAADSTQ